MSRAGYIFRCLLRRAFPLLGVVLILHLHSGILAAGRPVFSEAMLADASYTVRVITPGTPDFEYVVADPGELQALREYCLGVKRNVGGNRDGTVFATLGGVAVVEVSAGGSRYVVQLADGRDGKQVALMNVTRYDGPHQAWCRACYVEGGAGLSQILGAYYPVPTATTVH